MRFGAGENRFQQVKGGNGKPFYAWFYSSLADDPRMISGGVKGSIGAVVKTMTFG